MNIGEAAKKARQNAGLSRQKLADKSGYASANIRNIENNIVSPKINTVIDLAETLGISIYEYIGIKPKKEVVEVKHGEWLKTDAYPHRIFCSLCFKTYVTNEQVIEGRNFNCPAYCTEAEYCPHCGAKMDLKEGAVNG